MGLWDFVKEAGKSVFGEAEAAEPKSAAEIDTDRKVAALQAELRKLGLDNGDVHLTLRGDTVKIEAKAADRETMEKLILAVGNIKGIAKVEADLPPAPKPAGTEAAAPKPQAAPQAAPQGQQPAQGQQAAQPAQKPAAAPAPAAEDDGPLFHTVEKGDTLSAIAQKYLGSANKYRQIFEANKPMLKDPDEIYPGQKLRIPRG